MDVLKKAKKYSSADLRLRIKVLNAKLRRALDSAAKARKGRRQALFDAQVSDDANARWVDLIDREAELTKALEGREQYIKELKQFLGEIGRDLERRLDKRLLRSSHLPKIRFIVGRVTRFP